VSRVCMSTQVTLSNVSVASCWNGVSECLL
jgi:hypothetical protein